MKKLTYLTVICFCFATACTEDSTNELQIHDQVSTFPSEKAMVFKEKPMLKIKGSFTTVVNVAPGFPTAEVTVTGEGTMSHMGKSTITSVSTLNLTPPPPFSLTAASILEAANGDKIFTDATGTSTPQGGGVNLVIINHTIVGGTGRFENATGSLVGTTLTDSSNPNAPGFLTLEGEISY